METHKGFKTTHLYPSVDSSKNIKLFGFIAVYQKRVFKDEDPVNRNAAELMGKVYDQLRANG